jgi:hypothetical protein
MSDLALAARLSVPKAARARVASPPAGTALARAIRECLPSRVLTGARFDLLYVTEIRTYVNETVTSLFIAGLDPAIHGAAPLHGSPA